MCGGGRASALSGRCYSQHPHRHAATARRSPARAQPCLAVCPAARPVHLRPRGEAGVAGVARCPAGNSGIKTEWWRDFPGPPRPPTPAAARGRMMSLLHD